MVSPCLRLPPLILLPSRFLSLIRSQNVPSKSSRIHSTSSPTPEEDGQDGQDFYSLLLSQPLTHSSPQTINNQHQTSQVSTTSLSSSATTSPPPTATEPTPPKIYFSMPLAGPSARMRGLARGEKGLDRPPEPDNCCMSGCVNCVWEAYREEVEEWARAKRKLEREEERRLEGMRRHADVRYVGRGEGEGGNAVGDLDGTGGDGGGGFDGGVDEEGLFDEVPVGMREFMATEKRLRERREKRLESGQG